MPEEDLRMPHAPAWGTGERRPTATNAQTATTTSSSSTTTSRPRHCGEAHRTRAADARRAIRGRDPHPIHVVCAWMSDTQAVAMGHDLQVHDEHFDAAAAVHPALVATQTAAPRAAELRRTGSQSQGGDLKQVAPVEGLAARCDAVQDPRMTPAGFEPALPP